MKVENIIFDFGGVLVDWNPRYLYKDHFDEESKMEYFLSNICTDEWNLEQDKGRSLSEATTLLQNKFPEYHTHIGLFYSDWETMLKSDIPETVSIFYELKSKYKIYGLTNWSAETIPILYRRFSVFNDFDGIVVSGQEKLIKPDHKIYEILLNRYNINAENTVFIDDNIKNINAAKDVGLYAIHFDNPMQLKQELKTIGAI